jgi:HJR/Mrr/RecB family endonuclease
MLIAMSVIGASGTAVALLKLRGRRSTRFSALTPAAFERAIGAWLARDGWLVEHRGGSGDEGIDLLAFRGERLVVLQCKRYGPASAVTPAQVRELYGAATAVGATSAVMVTTGRVSATAISWANKLPDGGPVLVFRGGPELDALRARREKLLA